MSLTDHLNLKPSPSSALVIPEFHGGPLDGSQESPVSVSKGLLGKVQTSKGQYGLVGFRSSYPGDDFPSELSLDYAVFEWMSP
jgi:hypothetical protein